MPDLTAPRSWEGTILRAVRTPDGGRKLEVWDRRSKSWKPSGLGDKFMASPEASPAELRAAGISAGHMTA